MLEYEYILSVIFLLVGVWWQPCSIIIISEEVVFCASFIIAWMMNGEPKSLQQQQKYIMVEKEIGNWNLKKIK